MDETKRRIPFVESLKIDSLQGKWFARVLFVFVVAIYSVTQLFPIGDTDFSAYLRWYNQVAEAKPSDLASVGFPVITVGNIIFLATQLSFMFAYVFLSFLYLSVYLSERSQLSAWKGMLKFIKRLPTLILFVMIITVPFALPLLSFPPILIFIVPHVFLAPALIIAENKGPVEGVLFSMRDTYGIKLSIVSRVLILSVSLLLILLIFAIFIDPYVKLFRMIEGFFVAFYVLSFGRMMGVTYNYVISDKNRPAPEGRI